MRKSFTAVVCCAVVIIAAAIPPPAAEAGTRDCRNRQFVIAHIYDFSVRSMTCGRAEYLQRGSYGRSGWHFRSARRYGFRCGRIGSVYEGAVYRCRKGGSAFRFTFGA